MQDRSCNASVLEIQTKSSNPQNLAQRLLKFGLGSLKQLGSLHSSFSIGSAAGSARCSARLGPSGKHRSAPRVGSEGHCHAPAILGRRTGRRAATNGRAPLRRTAALRPYRRLITGPTSGRALTTEGVSLPSPASHGVRAAFTLLAWATQDPDPLSFFSLSQPSLFLLPPNLRNR